MTSAAHRCAIPACAFFFWALMVATPSPAAARPSSTATLTTPSPSPAAAARLSPTTPLATPSTAATGRLFTAAAPARPVNTQALALGQPTSGISTSTSSPRPPRTANPTSTGTVVGNGPTSSTRTRGPTDASTRTGRPTDAGTRTGRPTDASTRTGLSNGSAANPGRTTTRPPVTRARSGTAAARTFNAPWHVVEAGTGTTIALATFGPTLDDVLLLVAGSQALDDSIQLQVSDIRTAGGRRARLSLEPTTWQPTPNESLRLHLRGALPEVGVYRGILSLSTPQTRTDYVLEVKRAPGLEQLELDTISPAPLILARPGSRIDAVVRLDIAELTGVQTLYYPPVLKKLVTIGADGETAGASYASARFLQKTAEGKPATTPSTPTRLLEPGKTASYDLVMDGLRLTGQYEGTIEVATPSGARFTRVFKLYVKDHWWMCAWFIGMGAALSFYFRSWLNTGRSAAILELEANRVLEEIGQIPKDQCAVVREGLEQVVRRLLEDMRLNPGHDIAPKLDEVRLKLDNFRRIQDVLELQPKLAGWLPDGAWEGFNARFNALHRSLEEDGIVSLGTPGGFDKNPLVVEARAIRDALEEAAWTNLTERGERLVGILETDLGDLAQLQDAARAAPFREAFQALLVRAKSRLELVKTRASGETLDGAVAAYESIKKERDTHADAFMTQLATQETAPKGIEAERWRSLRAGDDDAPRQTPAAFRKAYLAHMLVMLEKKAETDAGQLGDHEAAADALREVARGCREAVAQLARDPDGAGLALSRLTRSHAQLVEAARKNDAGLTEASVQAVRALQKQSHTKEVDWQLPTLTPGASRARFTRQRVLSRINRNDALIFSISLAISIMIGLKVFWAGDNDFGSLVDYIQAFLWGFGLSELNRAALPAAASSLPLSWAKDRAEPG